MIKIFNKRHFIIFLLFILFFSYTLTVEAEGENGSSSGGSFLSDMYDDIKSTFRIVENIEEFVTNISQKLEEITNNLIQWIGEALILAFVDLCQLATEVIVDPLAAAVPDFLLETADIESMSIVHIIWKACLKIGLVLLSLLTVVGLGLGGNEAFRYENFGSAQDIWIRVFFTLGLMTASKRIFIGIYELAGWATKFVFSEVSITINTSWNVAGGDNTTKAVLFSIFVSFTIFLNLAVFIILIIRILDVMMMTALSSLASATFVLPNTSYVFKQFLQEYIAVILVQFIIIVVLSLWTGLATFTDTLVIKFTSNVALEGVAKSVAQGIMIIVLWVYLISRPGWIKRLLRVGSVSSIGNIMMAIRALR